MSSARLEPTTYGIRVPGKAPQSSETEDAQYDPELQRLDDRWPRLSAELRVAIFGMIDAIE